VVDTFGVTTPIPHYFDVDGAAGGWRMFALAAASADAAAASAHLLVVTPGVVAPNDGAASRSSRRAGWRWRTRCSDIS
jgi:hypothetical protein